MNTSMAGSACEAHPALAVERNRAAMNDGADPGDLLSCASTPSLGSASRTPEALLDTRLVADRLAVRVQRQHALRAMLDDYARGVQCGSETSLLRGATDADLFFMRSALTAELHGAVIEVAEIAAGSSEDLYGLAAELVDACLSGTPDCLLERWVRLSREANAAGVDA
jgi:hypothetical protein